MFLTAGCALRLHGKFVQEFRHPGRQGTVDYPTSQCVAQAPNGSSCRESLFVFDVFDVLNWVCRFHRSETVVGLVQRQSAVPQCGAREYGEGACFEANTFTGREMSMPITRDGVCGVEHFLPRPRPETFRHPGEGP